MVRGNAKIKERLLIYLQFNFQKFVSKTHILELVNGQISPYCTKRRGFLRKKNRNFQLCPINFIDGINVYFIYDLVDFRCKYRT